MSVPMRRASRLSVVLSALCGCFGLWDAAPDLPEPAPEEGAPSEPPPAPETPPRDTGWAPTIEEGARTSDIEQVTWSAMSGTEVSVPPLLPRVRMYPRKEADSVTMFRGGPLRAGAAHGRLSQLPTSLEPRWTFETSKGFLHEGTAKDWGGSAGWTGQPALVQWSADVKAALNVRPDLKDDDSFVEVIVGSLDGWVYFLNLVDGTPSREPTFVDPKNPTVRSRHLNTGNPIKGAVTVHPDGLPLLFVGQGLVEDVRIGSRIYRLTDGEELLLLKGQDGKAHRRWGAFDSSPLVDARNDVAWVPGENGLLYRVQLGTSWEEGALQINPVVHAMSYMPVHHRKHGIENSMSGWRNLAWFADNGGTMLCLNLETNAIEWTWYGETAADTNASLAVEVVDGVPYVYRGTEHEPNRLGEQTWISRHHGLSGDILWSVGVPTADVAPMSHGGVYGTPAIGRHGAEGLIYVAVSHAPKQNHGTLLALERETGRERWTHVFPRYVWSSPLLVYGPDGQPFVVQADVGGRLMLLDGLSGDVLHEHRTTRLIQSSPSAWNDRVVVPLLGRRIVAYDLIAP